MQPELNLIQKKSKRMDRNRLLGVLLFSISGLIVWFSFWLVIDGFSFPVTPEVIFGAFSASLASGVSSYIFSPNIYSLEKPTGNYWSAFGYGVLITLLSFLIGSFIFSIEFIKNETPDIISYVLFSLAGFLYSATMMSPGFILGGLTGILLYHLTKDCHTELNESELPSA